MTKAIWTWVLCGALTGCAGMPRGGDDMHPMAVHHCTKGDACTNEVTASLHGGVCTVSVQRPDIVIDRGNEDAVVTWTLNPTTAGEGYRFARYGVVFLDPDVRDQWKLKEMPHFDGQTVEWQDKNKNDVAGAKYAYIVVLVLPLGGDNYLKCLSPDPWIHNQ